MTIAVLLLSYIVYEKCFANSPPNDVQVDENDKIDNKQDETDGHTNDTNTETFLTDIEYEKRRKETKSNVELTSLNEEFADIWKGKVRTYYNSLVDHYEKEKNQITTDGTNTPQGAGEQYRQSHIDSLIDETKTSQESWELYCQGQLDYYEIAINFEYTTGSIVPIKLSNFERNLYRERAIFLYYLCRELTIDVVSP